MNAKYVNYQCPKTKSVWVKNFRPAGTVRSDLSGPEPVPVVKNPDLFHLWTQEPRGLRDQGDQGTKKHRAKWLTGLRGPGD